MDQPARPPNALNGRPAAPSRLLLSPSLSPSSTASRLYFLDWLRIAAFAVLVLYHVGMYYVRWDFHVKSPFAADVGPWLEPWMKLTEPWRMSLLFMVSGAATAFMLQGGATTALLRQRSKFLLLPLVAGVVFVVPPQSYFEVLYKHGYQGDYFSFLGLYFSHYTGFCQGGKCLILPTWNHLWFLPYVWLYTVALWLAVKLWPKLLKHLAGLAANLLQGPGLFLLPIASLLAMRLGLAERYPVNYSVWGDWYSHARYFSVFLTGAVFACTPAMWTRLAGGRWLALAAALACWASLVALRPSRPLEHLVIAIFVWSALVAAFGFAKHRLDLDHPWRARLVEAVFPVYIVHQTVIILASQVLLPWAWPPGLEALVLVLITFGLSWTFYVLVRRFARLRPWFGLRNPAL